MTSYFVQNDWTRHSDNVLEAKGFINSENRNQLIDFFNEQDTTCRLHPHVHHTVNNEEVSDVLFWDPECFTSDGQVGDYNAPLGEISVLLHQMNDAANRRTGLPMKLSKVVFHKYSKGSTGPEHADVYPLASLLYLNDDYQGGDLFFSKQNMNISPSAGSLLVFDGGEDHTHGVTEITEGVRYVFVAFWDYEEPAQMHEFWNQEQEKNANKYDQMHEFWNEDQEKSADQYGRIEKNRKRLESLHPNAKVLFADSFPILEIDNFIEMPLADSLVHLLRANNIQGDECFGTKCFPEYYKKAYREDPEPQNSFGVSTDTLQDINKEIKTLVAKFLDRDEASIAFSKFKGHNHITSSHSPPHYHQPGIAVAILVLSEGFEGGEVYIPSVDIVLKTKPYALYIYVEHEKAKHGISTVTRGERISLVSHWQDIDNPYDKAGANV